MSTNPLKYPIFSKEEPSELIEEIITSSGSPVVDCEYCGRTHYNSTGQYMDDGELEKLEAKHRANPEGYCAGAGEPRWGHLDGKQVFIGCPCNFLAVYEYKIWNYRHRICEYFKRRAEQEFEDAQETLEAAKGASKAIA